MSTHQANSYRNLSGGAAGIQSALSMDDLVTNHEDGHYDGETVILETFHAAENTGGGLFWWDSDGTSYTKSDHNGGTVIDPDIAWTAFSAGTWWTPAGSGNGVWVKLREAAANVDWFGFKFDNNTASSTTNLKAFEAPIRSGEGHIHFRAGQAYMDRFVWNVDDNNPSHNPNRTMHGDTDVSTFYEADGVTLRLGFLKITGENSTGNDAQNWGATSTTTIKQLDSDTKPFIKFWGRFSATANRAMHRIQIEDITFIGGTGNAEFVGYFRNVTDGCRMVNVQWETSNDDCGGAEFRSCWRYKLDNVDVRSGKGTSGSASSSNNSVGLRIYGENGEGTCNQFVVNNPDVRNGFNTPIIIGKFSTTNPLNPLNTTGSIGAGGLTESVKINGGQVAGAYHDGLVVASAFNTRVEGLHAEGIKNSSFRTKKGDQLAPNVVVFESVSHSAESGTTAANYYDPEAHLIRIDEGKGVVIDGVATPAITNNTAGIYVKIHSNNDSDRIEIRNTNIALAGGSGGSANTVGITLQDDSAGSTDAADSKVMIDHATVITPSATSGAHYISGQLTSVGAFIGKDYLSQYLSIIAPRNRRKIITRTAVAVDNILHVVDGEGFVKMNGENGASTNINSMEATYESQKVGLFFYNMAGSPLTLVHSANLIMSGAINESPSENGHITMQCIDITTTPHIWEETGRK